MLWWYIRQLHDHFGVAEIEKLDESHRALRKLIFQARGSVKKFETLGGKIGQLPGPLGDEIKRCPVAFEILSQLSDPVVNFEKLISEVSVGADLTPEKSMHPVQTCLPRDNRSNHHAIQDADSSISNRSHENLNNNPAATSSSNCSDFDACSIFFKHDS